MTKQTKKGKAIASMVLGILSFMFSLAGWVPLVMGIVAICLAGSSMSKDESGRGMAIAGLVLGILGTISSAFYALMWSSLASVI